ncbi:MAG: NnrS family protein [Myxococcales bacterium]
MALSLSVLSGGVVPTQDWSPQTLHAHEMIYGTVAPVIAGCLLTAVPNETSTLGLAAMNGLIHRGLASSDAAKMRTGTWGAVYLIVGLMRVISGGGYATLHSQCASSERR